MSGTLDLKTRWQVGRVHPTPESEPKGWTLRRLCDVAKLESGHTPSRKRPDYWDGDIPWLSLHDSKEIEGKEIFHTQHTVSKLGLDNSSARLLPKGTVALSRTATIGKVAILGREMATSQDFACYICGPDLFNHYLAHLFRGMETEWDRLMAGSTHNTIYMPLFESMHVLVPSLPEQRAIAAALSDADGVVAGLERVIAKKRLIKQGAMQDLLTARRRLPGFSGEWEVKRLGDHVRFLKNGTHSRAQLSEHGPVKNLHYGDIHGALSIFLSPATKPMPTLDSVSAGRLDRLAAGDLVFVDASEDLAGVGTSVEITDLGSTEVVSGLHTIAARFDKSVLVDGFKAFLQFMPAFRSHLCQLAAGTKVLATNRSHIASAEIPLPRPDEQQAIAAVLSDMDSEIQTLESRLAKARAVKEGMMQDLLTGRVRLV